MSGRVSLGPWRIGLVLAGVLLGGAHAFAEAPAVSRSVAEDSAMRESEHRRAVEWNLSDAEWTRYRALMEGVRGAVSAPGISPVEVLGIHARDPAERRRYAERWATLMHEDAERVLAFERAYQIAFRRLFPKGRAVELASLESSAPDHPNVEGLLELGDRLLVFLDVGCERTCGELIAGLLRRARLSPGVGLDLYFVGQPGDRAIQAWARAQGITADRVVERGVTLNLDGGLLASLLSTSIQTPIFPIVMHRRGSAISRIADPERLAL